jgi:predicted kinase
VRYNTSHRHGQATSNAMPNPACLHFLCGKAGAGKSTLATALAMEQRAILVSEDVWLSRLFGDRMKTFEDYKVFAQRLKTVVGPLVIDLLRAGQDVVLDFPANTRALRAWFHSLHTAAGAAHLLHHLDVPDRTCLQRIGQRNVERPEGSHHLTEADFAHISSFFEAPQEAEGFRVQVHAPA